jgi:hypothetical protein
MHFILEAQEEKLSFSYPEPENHIPLSLTKI